VEHVPDSPKINAPQVTVLFMTRYTPMLIAHQPFRLNCNMILHDTISIQKREDANRCNSYVELVVISTTSRSFVNILDLPVSKKKQLNFGPVPVHMLSGGHLLMFHETLCYSFGGNMFLIS
jgi:hypothetical protein